ncbi:MULTISPECIES: DUF2339 domain-containing protein [Paenibacillus]|uniref:DUF2339 domain-containing protein n=1 Tax=Paenibacillus TaxID=44249 RepID=UPI002FE39C51
MKDFRERLNDIKKAQNRLAQEYEVLLAEYESTGDVAKENETLRQRYSEYQRRVEELETRLRELERENGGLRAVLSEQQPREITAPDQMSQQRLEAHFSAARHEHQSRLDAIEQGAKERLRRFYEQADKYLEADQQVIAAKLAQFEEELGHRMGAHRQHALEGERQIRSQAAQAYASQPALTAGPAAENQAAMTSAPMYQQGQAEKKRERLEMRIGLNWINKLGILLILLGVVAAFQYSFSNWFSGYAKGASFFLLGILMLGGGEWMFRRKQKTFALGLLGGGISVLHGSVFYSYFLLDIIGLTTGLVLSVLVTAAAVFLSLRYDSRTICAFGLAGGYLPLYSYMIAFGLHENTVYAAMGYLLLLNASILAVSFRKRWLVIQYISFALHMATMLILTAIADNAAASMVYSVIAFLMYLGITLYVPFKYGSKLSWWDFSLLALNTVISCSTLLGLLEIAGWDAWRGGLALLFCLAYLGLARLSRKYLAQEKETRLLFYGTSLTFSLLIVPFQFGIHYMSLAWLVEGLLLSVLGHLYRYKGLERIGWGIIGLCAGAFIIIDSMISLLGFDSLDFAWKYTFISLGIFALTVFYGIRLQDEGDARRYNPADRTMLRTIKYTAMVNIWLYLLYETGRIYNHFMPVWSDLYEFYDRLLVSAVTLALAYGLSKAAFLHDLFVKYYVRVLYACGYLVCVVLTMSVSALQEVSHYNSAGNYISIVILVVFNLMVFFSGRDLIAGLLEPHPKRREWYPIILGVYLLGIISAFLAVQFHLGEIGWLFSLVYLLLAIGYIIYGFRYKYLQIRRIGLGLTLLATGKMLLFDLELMTTASKIAAYFSFGVALLGISYIYQRVSNKISAEAAERAKPHEEQEEVQPS